MVEFDRFRETAMNSSLVRADVATHVRIVALALIAGILVVVIGITARVTSEAMRLAEPRMESPITQPSAPPVKPARSEVVLV